MKGVLINTGNKYFTFLKYIFSSINNIQKEYNWLITEHECYPQTIEYAGMLSGNYCWVTGDELTDMIEKEDFQWIWGVFSAFPKDVRVEDVLKYRLPKADGYTGFWENPISIQHPLAEIEIIAWDSSMTIIISKNTSIINIFKMKNPLAQDLEKYNENKM